MREYCVFRFAAWHCAASTSHVIVPNVPPGFLILTEKPVGPPVISKSSSVNNMYKLNGSVYTAATQNEQYWQCGSQSRQHQ